MATYSGTTDPNIVNKYFTGTTEINLSNYLTRFNALKDGYLEIKESASKLYDELKPIYDAGLLPTGYTTQYNQLENFVNQ
jgi:hypothetical protein